jgi:hypothetical protein
MLSDPQELLARARRKELIKTVILTILFIAIGLVVLKMLIGDPAQI